MSDSCQPEAQHPELKGDYSHEEAIHVKSLMKEFRVDRSMMGRQAPESYRTTKRGQTAIPEEPPRGIGRLLVGRKTRPRRGIESSAAKQKQTKIECVPWMPKTKRSANTESFQATWKV